ncbi:MAG: diguanylate cyclase response regulator [Planctomycetota bacterium]|nr:MAG: diguanylate cyclase response regulator [Planctomycetota bacterium]
MSARILLVDDTPTVRYRYEILLRREGYEVDAACSAREALKILGDGSAHDLVVSDLRMPEMDGTELLVAIRSAPALQMLPLLMLTGSDEEQDVVRALELGAQDYVRKSCKPSELLARVKVLVHMKYLQDELVYAGETDMLTKLSNRRFGVKRLTDEIARSRRYERKLAVAIIDIDHFKRVNDALGHQAGDDVLVAVASELSRVSRESDCIIRWGGEEFLFVFPETSCDKAAGIVERFRQHLEQHAVPIEGAENGMVSVTVSGGVAQLRDDDSLESLIDRADAALYRAKDTGRNRLLRWEGAELLAVGP